ncbi:TonB-dependent receptor [uncultured Maribacter sp.]|uniref:SusC/RagA family TonB-linked outer membrane protein n=1 Tax=uncultured Maribacter sp. TaxID=431308 RepID=UPI002607B56E|nr:TonB-dependent receptor [uncultured Maribacter sp.]
MKEQKLKLIRANALLLFLFLGIGWVHAQETISGVITDDQKIPLAGVTVIVKGTNNGAVSDFDGNYSISASVGETLLFSYLGFKNIERVVTADTKTLNLAMQEDSQALEEVIVVGYGTQKKKEVTGAVAKVASDELVKVAVSDIGAAIQGKVAGVNIQAASGRPGEASNVQIRGLVSLNGGEPLYVVDNIPQEGNPNLAPEQIESIDVLKDGASASIYGVRGAGGVILITTKRGKKGKMKVDVNMFTGIQNITSGTPLSSTTDFLYVRETTEQASGTEPQTFRINANALDWNTNFVEEVQNDNAIVRNFNVNLSGGSENLTYNYNTTYYKQEGTIINSDFDRLTNRITGQFTKGKFKAFASASLTTENRKQEPWNIFGFAIGNPPHTAPFSAFETDGQNSVQLEDVDNAIFYGFLARQLDNTDDRENRSNSISLNAEYEILDGLSYKLNIGRNEGQNFRKFFQPQYLAFDRNGDPVVSGSTPQATLQYNQWFSKRETIEHILNYKKSFGKHNLDFLAVASYEKYQFRTLNTGTVFAEDASNDVQVLNAGADPITPSENRIANTLAGKLGRIQYNYDGKYLFSASFRRDGSSKFPKKNRYENFYGFSAGWNVSDEEWFNVDAISNLKIRGSWAQVGFNGIPDYTYIPVIESGVNYPFGADENLQNGLVQRRFPNLEVQWETQVSSNIGFELGLLNNKLNITADVYKNDKKDMLLNELTPPSAGLWQPRVQSVYGSIPVNTGNMVNKGVEVAMNYKGTIGEDFKFGISGTWTLNDNKITSLNGKTLGASGGRIRNFDGSESNLATTFLSLGDPAGSFYLLQHDGVIKTEEELADYQLLDTEAFGSPRLGDAKFKDANGDGIINDADRVFSGSGIPQWEAGLNLDLGYKNWDFSVQGYLSYGAEIFNGNRALSYQGGRHEDQVFQWTPQNSNSDIPTYRGNQHYNVLPFSDFWLEDGTYLRIRAMSLGYTIPDTQDYGVEKIRIYLNSVNPFTFTNYTGYDPEVGGDSLFNRGVDNGNYPIARQFMMGVQLSF